MDSLQKSLIRQFPFGWMDLDVFNEWATAMCDVVIPSSLVIVASNPDDDDNILGWTAVDEMSRAMHYLWVRRGLRGGGLGTNFVQMVRATLGLEPSEPLDYSIHTRQLDEFDLVAKWKMRYQPWKLTALPR